jgi:hypothetical protein
MNPLIQFKKTTPLTLAVLVLVCLTLSPRVQAVVPAPDGGYPGGNTAEGQAALLSLTTGGFNTAVGFFSLFANSTGSFNTAFGAGALDLNTADNNTATGAAALLLNTTGTDNTANGVDALVFNNSGSHNTANGAFALFSNTTANDNTANGAFALESNTTGVSNTEVGVLALESNTTGSDNVALGTAVGFNATTGSNNVYIGAGMVGVAGESNACYIASIFGQTSANGTAVFINSDGKLGTVTSSRRFKDGIKPMEKTSEVILALKPVTFHYKSDNTGTPQFGLIAEEVAEVNPDLVVRDNNGDIYTVRYDAVNAMLLNEFLKEHKTVQEQGATITRLQKQIEALTTGLQKVSAQLAAAGPSRGGLEASKAAPQVVNNP